MKLLSGYIKRNLIWLCLIFLITMLHLGYMLLINVKSADIGYSIILDLMITAVVFIIGFVLYAKKVKKLGKILEHPVEEQKELPEPADDIELAYSDIIENHDIARSEAVNHMQKQQSTTKDYYARQGFSYRHRGKYWMKCRMRTIVDVRLIALKLKALKIIADLMKII